eukprot:560633_1
MYAQRLAVVTTCIIALLHSFISTTSSSEELLSNNNILYLNNFVFNFDLTNRQDWNKEYLVSHAYNDFNREIKHRGLLEDDELEQALQELDFNTYYDNNAYMYQDAYYDADDMSSSLAGSAASCTHTIPGIFKQLCVHWDHTDGFKFTFAAQQDDDNNLEWYYGDVDAYEAEHQQLDQKEIYLNRDYDWDNVDLVHEQVQQLNQDEDLMDRFNTYASSRSVRKCGHYTGMRMCVVFNPHRNQLKVQLALPRSRFIRQQTTHSIPANFDAVLAEQNELYYDEEEEEDYADDDDDYYEDYYSDNDYDYDTDYYNDMYLEDDFYAYDDSGNMDSFDEWWRYHYGRYFDNNNVFNAEKFDYGDALGFEAHNRAVMDLNSFKCLNCEASAAHQQEYNAYEDELQDMVDMGYEEYGDYIYYFDDRVLNWDDAKDWTSIQSDDDDTIKCSISIPGLDHKLCVAKNSDDKDFRIGFEAASQQEIDDAYYDFYGYDEYYYNMQDDDTYDDEGDEEKERAHIKSRYSEYSEGSKDGNYYGDSDGDDRLREWQGNDDHEEDRDEDIDEQHMNSQYMKHMRTMVEEQSHSGNPDAKYKVRRKSSLKGGRRSSTHWSHEKEDKDEDVTRRLLYDYDDYEDYEDYEDDDDYADYEDYEEYYNSLYFDEAEFTEAMRSELEGMDIQFKHDGDWDEINRIDTMDDARTKYNYIEPYSASKVYDGDALQKCKTLQTAQICATWNANKGFEVNVRVGAHKHLGLNAQQLAQEYDALVEQFGDDMDYYDEDEEEDHIDSFFDSEHDSEWIVTNEVTDEFDTEWLDESKWIDVDQVVTYSAHALKKKCMNVFGRKLCLCEFVGFVKKKKHVCHPWPNKGKKKKKKKGNQKLIKEEKKKIKKEHNKVAKENKVIAKENAVNKKMQKELREYKRKVRKLKRKLHQSQVRMHKLHQQPPHNRHQFRFNHPHHHRHFHLHVHHHIPWERYRHHAHEVPEKRPAWLPKWIWRELNENYKHSDAHADAINQYYDYYEYLKDYYGDELYEDAYAPVAQAALDAYDEYYEAYEEEEEEEEAENEISINDLQDQWVDEEDGSSWIVSNDAVDEYDTQWNDDEEWDEVNTDILTASGNKLTRKCMHMWGHRLCLCQFLDWMDSHKYKCTITTDTWATAPPDTAQNTPWMHKLPHEIPQPKMPHKISNEYHMKAKVNSNGKKHSAELHVKSNSKISKKAMAETFGDDLYLRRLMSMQSDVSSKMADEWYDSEDSQLWGIANEVENEFDTEWMDDELWDQISPPIITKTGHSMKRKCMNIFGRKLCLCQFLNWIKFGETKHECGRKQALTTKKEKQMNERIQKEQKLAQQKKNDIQKEIKKEKVIEKKIVQKEKQIKPKSKPVQVKKIKQIIAKKKRQAKGEEKKIEQKEKQLHKLNQKIQKDKQKVKPIQVKRVQLKKIPLDKQNAVHKLNEIPSGKAFKLKMKQRLNTAPNNRKRMRMMRMRMMQRLHDGMPPRRPNWLPHYFWHWLHHGHVHRFHHHPRHWKLWRPRFRKVIRFLKMHELAHRLHAMPFFPPPPPPPGIGMPLFPPPLPMRFGRPPPPFVLRGIHPLHGPPMPPLLRHAPRPPFALHHGPKFIHPIHLEIMLMKRPKLLRKLRGMHPPPPPHRVAAAMDYYDDYDDDYYYDEEEDENGDYWFEEDDANIVVQKPFVANAMANDEYMLNDNEDNEDNEESETTLRDEWVDEDDGSSWFVSNKVMDDYDQEWENDDEWDQVNEEIVTLHGNQITRKCMHMWGHRLCLCQFLNFIDSRKYKCLPSGIDGLGGLGGLSGGMPGVIQQGSGVGLAVPEYKEYHSYGSPGITHHVTLNHDPDQVNHETIHLIGKPHKNTKITHEVNYKVSSNIKHGTANEEEYGDYYAMNDADEEYENEYDNDNAYVDQIANAYDNEYEAEIGSAYDNEYEEEYSAQDDEYEGYDNAYALDNEYGEEIGSAYDNEYEEEYSAQDDEYEGYDNAYALDNEYGEEIGSAYDNEYEEEYDSAHDDEYGAAFDSAYDNEDEGYNNAYEEEIGSAYDNEYEEEIDSAYDNEDEGYNNAYALDNEYEKEIGSAYDNEYEEEIENEYEEEYDNAYALDNEDDEEEIGSAYDNEYEEEYSYALGNEDNDEYGSAYDNAYVNEYNDEEYESQYDNDDAYGSANEYDSEYGYEEEESEDQAFAHYFNGNNDIEEQNGDMEPDIFWTMNVFAMMCGVVLCFCMGCYFLRKRRKNYQFSPINSKTTDFEDSASEYSNNKYGFHPVNISMNQKFSDDDEEEEEEDQDYEQQSAHESHESDEYQDNSDEDLLRSKKHQEMHEL